MSGSSKLLLLEEGNDLARRRSPVFRAASLYARRLAAEVAAVQDDVAAAGEWSCTRAAVRIDGRVDVAVAQDERRMRCSPGIVERLRIPEMMSEPLEYAR